MRRCFWSLLGLAALFWAGNAGAEPSLLVYTSQPSDQMIEVLRLFGQKYPGIKVDLFRSGTTEIVNKLQAELAGGAPKADVVLLADAETMRNLKNLSLLYAYRQAPVAGYDPRQYDPDMTYFGTKLITTGIIYNTHAGVPVPTSWNDLLKPAARDQVILPSPLYSGAATIHVGIMAETPGFGWGYFEKLAQNGAIAAKGNGNVLQAVATGEKAYGIIIDYMAYDQKHKGSPVDYVFPAEGVTAINQPVAILKTTKNLQAAKDFVDFQLSRDAQIQAVSEQYFPLLKGLTPPAGYPDPATIKIMTGDPARLLKETDDTKQRFADIFGG